jgi:perosamine synthetase
VIENPPAFEYDPLSEVSTDEGFRPTPRIRLASPVTGEEEIEAVREVLASGILTNGPWTRRFESAMAERHGTEHAVALANGTVALAAMYVAAGIGPGDEVIVPSLTFIGTATSVLHVGATPVFADIRPDTLNLDPDDVAARITPRTKAIVPVHYGGQSADMGKFRALADEAQVLLFEDAAQAHGASFNGRPVGSWGDAAMFSFTATKNITTGEGAVVTTDDGDFARQLRILRNHGMTKQYFHEVVGWNWRLSEMQAAIGTCQVERLDQILGVKRANAVLFGGLLAQVPGVQAPVAPADRDHPYMLYTVSLPSDRRDDAIHALTDAGIESRIYFPPAHHQPVFSTTPQPELPVTDDAAARILSLPFHSRLGRTEFTEIVDVLRNTLTSES